MKKVKLNTLTKESIADIEKEISNIALNLVKEKQAKFKDLGLRSMLNLDDSYMEKNVEGEKFKSQIVLQKDIIHPYIFQ
ncbi:hypothetical protein MKY83_12410 [Bacillus sp. FSL M8-0266]|uniref:hypothetical protein n=1 Tax=Bacillus TaxID=1386 RepID=UPI000AE4BD4F|nr:hypothetical protein [Bacillus pumilus]MCY7577469.1 hypothetical protein [Bacillus pumilus]WFO46367.1 hypothetical protein MK860_12400 [Bacillus pumilus]